MTDQSTTSRNNATSGEPGLSVVIPVHDEATNIAALIEEVAGALTGRTEFELVIVDDASADDTITVISTAMPSRPWLRLLKHHANAGQSSAILTGVKAANAAWIATLDGDGQNDPADIPALLEMRDANPDLAMICGHRTKRRDTALRKLSSRIANGVRGGLLGDDTPDTGCGLKLFRREIFLALPYFDHAHRFLPALFRLRGGQIASVSVNHRPRGGGRSHYGVWNRLWVGIVDLIGVMWLKRRAKIADVSEHGNDQ